MKNNIVLIIVILIYPLFPNYEVGATISEFHQEQEYEDICYGDYPTEKFKLSDFQNKG